MLSDVAAGCRLACAGFKLARHDGFIDQQQLAEMPWPARAAVKLARIGRRHGSEELSSTLARIGPSYIKLGQFLATRPDIVG
ncbi:MAG: ubiquinone biosynthesis protein UbiB, partial [Rhizobiales bacterium]|nr:ubiquinone biosynthesis protein UbiB [Hyphomicrobiales bacterium]